jgi:ATP-dependent Clp protease ATP-binding subunit ClpB
VIVMTSNLGSQYIQDIAEKGGGDAGQEPKCPEGQGRPRGASEEQYTQMKASVMGVVQAHFRPEFINRLDEIVVFRALDKTQIRQIARIQIEYLAKRLTERQLALKLSDKALDLLGNVGFDPVYGARPLKRAIQQQLENPLAREILEGKFRSGDTVSVDAQSGHLVFART